MDNLELRQCVSNDLEMLCHISRQTFAETFAADNSAYDMRKYLDESFSPLTLGKELNNPSSAFYFATAAGEVIGYLKVNTGNAQTEPEDPKALEIERIYVLQKYQGKQAGKFLLDKALEIAQQKHASFAWLGVWEYNHKAIGFYQKNGFREFDKHIFSLGNDRQTDIMMKREVAL